MSKSRGHHPHTSGKRTTSSTKTDDEGIPFDPQHLKDECYNCKNWDKAAKKKVQGHRQGVPICPLVRDGTYPMNS